MLVKKNISQHYFLYFESMVKYYGKHSCKQFIRNKSIRFRYKVWFFCSTEGYLVDFDIYQGKSPSKNEGYQKVFEKATAPLVQMFKNLSLNKMNLPYHLFCDNLFAGLKFLIPYRKGIWCY